MNLLLVSIGLGALLFVIVALVHKVAIWMQGRELEQLKGKKENDKNNTKSKSEF